MEEENDCQQDDLDDPYLNKNWTKYFICRPCNKKFTEKEGSDLEYIRLKKFSENLKCSIELARYIEKLEEKIENLENTKIDKPPMYGNDW